MQDETALYGAKMMQPGMTAADSEENNLRPQHLEDYICLLYTSQLATKEDVDSVIAAALAFCKSAANYHEKYEAAFMDMLQCAFTLSEKRCV